MYIVDKQTKMERNKQEGAMEYIRKQNGNMCITYICIHTHKYLFVYILIL